MNSCILISTIFVFGLLGGFVNAIRTEKQKKDYWKSLVKGVVAAFLVPIFLEVIKSEIGRNLNNNLYDYLIFGGLCLIAAIFSDKFIDTIGEKILQKAESAEREAKESNEKVNTLIEKEAEPETEQLGIESKIQEIKESSEFKYGGNVEKVINALNSKKYKYRTTKGLVEECGLSTRTVMVTLSILLNAGIVKRINSGKRTLWTLSD
jgi:hypothetical protein